MAQDEREVSYLDRQNKWMLWNILRKNKDTTFMDQAKKELLFEYNRKEKKDGQEIEVAHTGIDRSVMGYLTGVLGKDAMPILRDVYETPNLDDRIKSEIRKTAVNYVGVSEDSNIIVNSRMNEGFALLASLDDKKQEKENRERGLRTISYYLGSLGYGREVSPDIIQQRRQFLNTLRPQSNDPEIQAMMDKLDKRFDTMADPEQAKKIDKKFDPRVKR